MRPGLTPYAQQFTPGTLDPRAIAGATEWARGFGADNPRVLRYMTFFPWVHPDIVPERQEILAKIYAFYRFYDDFNDSLHSDLRTSRTVANRMIGILDGEKPAPDAAAVLWMFHGLWREHEEVCPPEFLARTSSHWRHYFATQSNYHAMRKPDYPWDLADYLSLRIDNGGLHVAISQGELANTVHIPAHLYRMPSLVTMRRLTYYCVILTNDLYSALRDEKTGDHRNPVAQHMRHEHVGREKAFAFVQDLLFEYSARLHRMPEALEHEMELLELTGEERAVARTAGRNCLNHSDGYEAWASHNEPHLATPDADPGIALRPLADVP
ncbi:terpene synthase family protein [Streptomyces daliensis]